MDINNGIKIQWGRLTTTGGNGYGITFGTSFNTTGYSSIGTQTLDSAHNFDDVIMFYAKTVSNMCIYFGETGAGGARTMLANWVAIGY